MTVQPSRITLLFNSGQSVDIDLDEARALLVGLQAIVPEILDAPLPIRGFSGKPIPPTSQEPA